MIEMLACTAMLTLIVIAVVRVTMSVDALRVNTRDSVYLSVHNLNCMERIRQECLEGDGDLLLFYSDDKLGTVDIETNAYLEKSTWDHYYVYSVRIESNVRDTKQKLNSEYIITNIGGISYSESLEG